MKTYLCIILCLLTGCSTNDVSDKDLTQQIEKLDGFVVRDEADRIIFVNLASCQVPDTLIRQLPTLNYLQTLHLEYSNIDNADLKTIGQITSLEVLNISETKTTDQGLHYLSDMEHLNKLEMSHYIRTQAGSAEEAMEMLRERLESTAFGKPENNNLWGEGLKALKQANPELEIIF